MLNHITIMGRLTRDPELRRTGSGIAVASFTVAVDRDFGGKDGGEKETDFIDCVAWRQTGEFVSKYFTKGRMIVVSGLPARTACTVSSSSQTAGRVRVIRACSSLTRTLAFAPHTSLMVASAIVTTALMAAQTMSLPASA